MASREQFSSKFGFIMAAAGSAIGLGNIWGFPTNTASNGGGAFVLVYFIMAFCLAYPVFMAELIIGRNAKANMVTALNRIGKARGLGWLGTIAGSYGIIVASLILCFYAIVAGWMAAYLVSSVTDIIGINARDWLTGMTVERNLIFMALFMALTMAIIARGVTAGIERWSTRLMPMLFVLMLALIIYVLLQKGAMEGLKIYLLPDFSQITPDLILSALGQAFFSMSLGVGTMLIYGSYLSDQENLPQIGAIVTLTDSGIAFVAGLLIIPAIYVAQEYGTTIMDDTGALVAGPDLIFQILPSLFESMGSIGMVVALVFFALMTIAALTSSISMLEVPVAFTSESTSLSRPMATLVIGGVIFLISATVVFNFGDLFGLVVSFTTEISQPILGFVICLFAGWIWHRNQCLAEIQKGLPDAEIGLFWKIWPWYVRVVCPLLIIATFVQTFL